MVAPRSGLVCVAAGLAACTVPAQASLWDSFTGAVSGAVSAAKDSAASNLDSLVKKTENLTGSALESAMQQACDFKTWEDISEVNNTMVNQLENDCESTASNVPYMHDHVFGACESMGLWNINRTLEQQKAKMKGDCMDALHKAPGDIKGTIATWSESSKQTLTEKVGPSVQDAIKKARESVEGQEKPEAKFIADMPTTLSHRSLPRPGVFLQATPLLVAMLGLFAWRRVTSLATPDEQLLDVSAQPEEPEYSAVRAV